MAGITRSEDDPQTFHVDWSALHGGLNPWKRANRVAVDPYLVAKAVTSVMRLCPHQSATGRPLVWNAYTIFLDLADWERIKKLEATLVRDLGQVVRKALDSLKAEMVGALSLRLLRDEGLTVRSGTAIVRADFKEGDPLPVVEDPNEMTIRVPSGPPVLAEFTQRVPDLPAGFGEDGAGSERLQVHWPGGAASIRSGSRVVLGRPHPSPTAGFVALTGAGSKVNKRQLWIEAAEDGAVIGRLSDANPVEVKGRLIQAGGQIAIDTFPAEITLSNGAFRLTVDRPADGGP